MLHSSRDLEDCSIRAIDGMLGVVKDLYFDDHAWVVRYFIVETGAWLSSRKVLVSPLAVGHPDWSARVMPVSITQEQVKNGPDIDTAKPVSRFHEMLHLTHYHYPYYWEGGGLWGTGATPASLLSRRGHAGAAAQYLRDEDSHRQEELVVAAEARSNADHHLRSCNTVMKYHIHATDGDIGHLEGLLVDDENWAIRYILVQTSHWWHGHQVIIPPHEIDQISWPDSKVFVNLTREALRNAAQYEVPTEGGAASASRGVEEKE